MTSFRLSPTWVCGTHGEISFILSAPKNLRDAQFFAEAWLVTRNHIDSHDGFLSSTVPNTRDYSVRNDVVIGLCYLLLDSYIELTLVKKFGNMDGFLLWQY